VCEVQSYGTDSPYSINAVDVALSWQIGEQFFNVLAYREGHDNSLQLTYAEESRSETSTPTEYIEFLSGDQVCQC
jgi:hypothetical protein